MADIESIHDQATVKEERPTLPLLSSRGPPVGISTRQVSSLDEGGSRGLVAFPVGGALLSISTSFSILAMWPSAWIQKSLRTALRMSRTSSSSWSVSTLVIDNKSDIRSKSVGGSRAEEEPFLWARAFLVGSETDPPGCQAVMFT